MTGSWTKDLQGWNTTASMAATGSAGFDPLGVLRTALSLPTDSDEQGAVLAGLRDLLEATPQPVPMLCTTLVPSLYAQPDSLIRQWIFDLLWFAVAKANLPLEVRTKCERSRPLTASKL